MRRIGLAVVFALSFIAAPLAGRSQQAAKPVIGYLHFASPGSFEYQIAAFRQGLSETGYVEGQNVAVEYRWAEGRYDRMPALAGGLVRHGVNVIVAIGPLRHMRPKTLLRRSPSSSRWVATRSQMA